MNKKLVAVIVIALIVLLAVAGYLWAQQPTTTTPASKPVPDTRNQTTNGNNETEAPTEQSTEGTEEVAATIVYTNDGFSNPNITVKAGDTIRIQNDSDSTLSFNSDDHPTHTKQSELNVGEIEAGQSKTFMIDAKGTWGYHNHFNDSHMGKIVVE